jgi:hypothetical protein
MLIYLFRCVTAAIMIAQYSYGGTITNQIWVFTVAFVSTFSIYKAWSSIRRLRIDLHREWVLRTWSYACAVSFSFVLERWRGLN